jgi:hypothetical protein
LARPVRELALRGRACSVGKRIKIVIELSEEDGEEMVELGQQLLAVVDRLEDLEKRLEVLLDET